MTARAAARSLPRWVAAASCAAAPDGGSAIYSCDNRRVVLTKFLHSKNCMPALCADGSAASGSSSNNETKPAALACEVDDPPIITDVGPMEKCIEFESCGHGDQDDKDCGAVYYDCSSASRRHFGALGLTAAVLSLAAALSTFVV